MMMMMMMMMMMVMVMVMMINPFCLWLRFTSSSMKKTTNPSPNHGAQANTGMCFEILNCGGLFLINQIFDIFVCGNCLLTCCTPFMIGKALLAMILSIHPQKTTAGSLEVLNVSTYSLFLAPSLGDR